MSPRSNVPSAHTPRGQPVLVRPAFQSRKTLVDCVRDNLTLANRRTYYQRIIFVAKHLESSKEFTTSLSKIIREKLGKAERYAHGENISGLIMFYTGYSVYMLEGSEEAIGPFLRMIGNRDKELFLDTRVILTFNNINNNFFKKIVWCTADPPVLMENVPMERLEDVELQCVLLLKKIYNLCKKLNEEDSEGNLVRSYSQEQHLDASFNKLMPEIALIDALLTTKYILSVGQLAGMYEAVPRFQSYDSSVWPIPFSYCPMNIFTNDEYEVNLIFNKDPKKRLN